MSDRIEVSVVMKVECAECGEALDIESTGSLNYESNEFKVTPCDTCIASASEIAEEQGYDRGKQEGYDEGFKDGGGEEA
jgi:hypothetical protein